MSSFFREKSGMILVFILIGLCAVSAIAEGSAIAIQDDSAVESMDMIAKLSKHMDLFHRAGLSTVMDIMQKFKPSEAATDEELPEDTSTKTSDEPAKAMVAQRVYNSLSPELRALLDAMVENAKAK